MKLVVAGVLGSLLSLAGSAAGRAAFDEYGAGVAPRTAEQLQEAACELDVELRGAVAIVEQRQRIANPGARPLAASLELELPAGAEVISFALRDPRRPAADVAIPVDARSPTLRGGTPGVDGFDPAFAARVPGGGLHAILQPIEGGQEVVAITRYVAVAQPRAGTLRLVIPGRQIASPVLRLARCKGSVRAAAGPGAAIRRLRVAGIEGPAGRPAMISVGELDVAIAVELDVPGAQPIAWAQTEALADGWSATLVTVLGPAAARSASPRRVVFVIDGSRSMDLVGRPNVAKVIARVGAALPAGSELEAILYDRRATRVFGELRPATAANLAAIDTALGARGAVNGSDLAAALGLAKQAIAAPNARGQAMIVIITDGVTGDVDGPALIRALDAKTSTVDVHAIVLDPAHTTAPNAAALRAPVHLYGGAYVEVPVAELDDALGAIDEWLRPSWLALGLGGHEVPPEVRAGGGFTRAIVHRGPARLALTGHGDAKFTAAVAAAPAAPIAALALGAATAADFAGGAEPTDADLVAGAAVLERARAAHPFAGPGRAFAVLAPTGRVAKLRRDLVAGGGRYERVIAFDDPPPSLTGAPAPPAAGPSAIARVTLERLFRDQLQPRAFVCYQRALGTNPKLAGTVHFQLRLGRGEVTEVTLTGLGDAQLDACLLDAAYVLTPPLPDFSINADDQTIANYPLTFARRDDQPWIVLGDADSKSPLDIDAIEGGVPGRRTGRPDTDTPLGGLRPSKSP